jgi:NADPH-dependent curcumin reductase CurA
MAEENLNKQWVYTTRPVGEVTESNYELREAAIPQPAEGQLLVKAKYIRYTNSVSSCPSDLFCRHCVNLVG